jgi:hypothetical protein
MNPEVAQVDQPRVFTYLLRVGHLVPIAALLICIGLSCVGLVVEHIQFEVPAGWIPVENTTTTTTTPTTTTTTTSTLAPSTTSNTTTAAGTTSQPTSTVTETTTTTIPQTNP